MRKETHATSMRRPRFDLLALDIDGTLLDDDFAIPPRHREAVRAAQEAGVQIALVSGRALPAVRPYYADLGIEGLAVSCNGARVTRVPQGDDLFHRPLEQSHAETIIGECEVRGLHLNVYVGDHLYAREYTPWARLYHERTGSRCEEHADLVALAAAGPTKLLIVTDPDTGTRLADEFRARFDGELYVTLTMPEYVEFMHREVSKADGLAKTAQALGIDRSRVAAAGDSYSDISMIRWAGLGIAMANGVDPCRAAADVVAPSNSENGLAWAIEQYVL